MEICTGMLKNEMREMRLELEEKIKAAKGEIPFDKLFIHANIINTYTGKIIRDASVGIKKGVIVSVCPGFDASAKEVVDCEGMYMTPSFIDAHMHIESSRLHPLAYAQGAVPHGTGCIMTDPMQLVNASGEKGFLAFVRMLKTMPMRAYIQFPSRVPAVVGMEHSGADFSPEDTARLMQTEGVLTLGEVNAYDLSKESTLQKMAYAHSLGKMMNGHCPGLGRDAIMGAASAGLRDDHESETFEELMERLNAGMSVMIREGTIEPNCSTLVKGVVQNQISTSELMFCTDDKSPEDIVANGCIDNCVRIAISEGLAPIEAIKMATINPAKHFHIEDKMGVIAPGRYADFLLLKDLEHVAIESVFFGGEKRAEHGKALFSFTPVREEALLQSIHLPENLEEEDICPDCFSVAIEMLSDSLLTRKISGCTKPDIDKDILPISVIDRYTGEKHVGTALIKGLGIKRGAVASSCAQEGNNIVVSGTNRRDMLLAVKEIQRIGGGNVVCIDGKIAGTRCFPIGGIVSDKSLWEELEAIRRFNEALKLTGSENPILMAALTVSLCPSIPEIGLTDMGIIENGVLINGVNNNE